MLSLETVVNSQVDDRYKGRAIDSLRPKGRGVYMCTINSLLYSITLGTLGMNRLTTTDACPCNVRKYLVLVSGSRRTRM